MDELKDQLINKINTTQIDHYNENTFLWSKGFKKALLEVIEKINSIKSIDTNGIQPTRSPRSERPIRLSNMLDDSFIDAFIKTLMIATIT